MEGRFEAFDLAPTFERLDGVPVTNVIRFEEAPTINSLLTPAVRLSA